MSELKNITGDKLIDFFEYIGCNVRNNTQNNAVLWSINTGDFFVVPKYNNELIDNYTLTYILDYIGIAQEVFFEMWNQYNNKKN